MPRFHNRLTTPRVRIALAAAALALALAAWFARPFFERPNPLLSAPTLALRGLAARSLYYNGTARPWLLALRPDLLTAEDRDAQSERVRDFAQAVQNPKLFRQLDRQWRFDALLLTGDPSQFRPLLDHLVETKDWALFYVDHTSLVFKRGGRVWQMADLAPVRAEFAGASPRDRAKFLAQTATKLLALHRAAEGKQLLDEATHLDSRLPDSWNALAIYHMDRAEWREAMAGVERALALDSRFVPALATKTQLLYATKHFSEAFELSRELIEKLPEDPGVLFYHAKIAHEAHAYKSEIEVLKKLIARAEGESRPIAGYLLYLGQAYAATGEAKRAVDAFMDALNDADLPVDQRAFARECIARIKSRTGM